ncbi:MAG: hypothetical protein RL414_406 [Actinomycetota bacterium]|jgi:CubicO group peptidase (beta-lactamase class C family)
MRAQSENFVREDISLDNWKDLPFSTWSFQNVQELIPVAEIPGASSTSLPQLIDSDFLQQSFSSQSGTETYKSFLERSHTDAFLLLKSGEIVSDWYTRDMHLHAKHLIFSISKSLTGALGGIIFKKFDIDLNSKVGKFLDIPSGSAYATATLRNLLDMSVSLNFDESYSSTTGIYARYRQAMLWMNRKEQDAYSNETLEEFILGLEQSEHEHGVQFNYRSPNSDLLGRVIEIVGGKPFAELMSQELWIPLGCSTATITVDAEGMARTAGGISCSIHDLALLAESIRLAHSGMRDGVISQEWALDTFGKGDREIWRKGDFANFFPEGSYRNQWYSIDKNRGCAIGIHGQWIYIDFSQEIVAIRLSSQASADDDSLDESTLALFESLAQSCVKE